MISALIGGRVELAGNPGERLIQHLWKLAGIMLIVDILILVIKQNTGNFVW